MMERFLDAIIPKFWKCKQENNYLPSETPEDPADSRSLREPSLKASAEDEALEKFLVNPASEREEALELCEALYGLCRDKLSDSDTDLQGDGLSLEDIIIFLKEFPDRKMKLEERIQGLHAVADQIEKTHKKCAITNVVAGSTSVVSGVMTILGLALAPVTVGGSLILSASGIGLGALATVTSLSSNVIEHASNLAARERVSNHEGTKAQAAVEILCKEAPHLLSAAQKCVTVGNQVMEEISKNIRAFRLAKANPRLTANAKKFMGAGYLSTWRSQKVEKAFSGTALAMTKGSRVMSAMTAGALVLVDMITFMHDLNHLLKGAEAEMAGELREQAQELENKLKELSQAYNNLLDIITSHSQREGEAGDNAAGSSQ